MMPREAVGRFANDRARRLVSLAVLAAVCLTTMASVAFLSSFAWPQIGVGDRDVTVEAGLVTDYAVGEPVFFQQGRFWLVRQPDGSFVAFSAADSFRGCTVVWQSDRRYVDPRDRVEKQGWYRDPCHGSIYDRDGTKVFGPSPRDLDTYPVTVIGRQIIVHAADRSLMHGNDRPELQPFGAGGG
jgi:Rieske Fe-S protein